MSVCQGSSKRACRNLIPGPHSHIQWTWGTPLSAPDAESPNYKFLKMPFSIKYVYGYSNRQSNVASASSSHNKADQVANRASQEPWD